MKTRSMARDDPPMDQPKEPPGTPDREKPKMSPFILPDDTTSSPGNTKVPGTHTRVTQEPSYSDYSLHFLGASEKTIKSTFKSTTQYARKLLHPKMHMQKFYKSPHPAMNTLRRQEPIATDTVKSDTPSRPGGYKCAQLFVGRHSLVGDIFGVKTDRQFVNALQDVIRKRGAPTMLISDSTQAEMSKKVAEICRELVIKQ